MVFLPPRHLFSLSQINGCGFMNHVRILSPLIGDKRFSPCILVLFVWCGFFHVTPSPSRIYLGIHCEQGIQFYLFPYDHLVNPTTFIKGYCLPPLIWVQQILSIWVCASSENSGSNAVYCLSSRGLLPLFLWDV